MISQNLKVENFQNCFFTLMFKNIAGQELHVKVTEIFQQLRMQVVMTLWLEFS